MKKLQDIKVDPRPQKKLWAPGDYLRRCKSCDEEFIGDKRAIMCADCAYGEKYDRQWPADMWWQGK